eukprot:TRINITY_DN12725_c0_g1_i1.p1 TRINITY_DN12725_c0_g1~~TRINITY_DN12725_c0_g1_i1.p1  ORF type:complete len:767 (+),score=286.42 TRINITY_DN12725_c0_g1_i1:94-2301(+)
MTEALLRRDLDQVSLERIRLVSEVRRKEQDLHERDAEITRLRNLVESMQDQHRERVQTHLVEKEKLSKKVRISEDAAQYAERALQQSNEELERSLAEREELSNMVNALMRDKENRMYQMHQAQDEADEWQTKAECLGAERRHDGEELQALRATAEFNEEYIRTIKQGNQRLQELVHKLQSELAVNRLASDTTEPAQVMDSVCEEQTRHHHHHPHHPHHTQSAVGYDMPQGPAYDSYDEPPRGPRHGEQASEDYYLVDDPMSPMREQRHYFGSPQQHSPPPEQEAGYPPVYPSESPRNRDYEAEMQRMSMKLEKMQTDLHTTRVEESYVQKEYMIEAGTRLNGALAALETLCAVIADWKASISCGRDPWGKLASREDELALRRLRDIEKRATMKKEVTRTLQLTGMAEDAVAVLEVFFASGRVRDAVTYVVESFQASKEAADACMGHAKRTIEESVSSAKAQQDSMSAMQGDAGQLDAELRNLTQAKFAAENEIEKLKRQVEERDSYQKEVERLSKLMKDEAQDERKKMSEIAIGMTEKQQEEISRLREKQREELDSLDTRHMQQVQEIHSAHSSEVARAAAETQQLKDHLADLQRQIEEKDRQLESEIAKKRAAKNARERVVGEATGLKQAMATVGQENRELRGMLKTLDKENMVLKDLSTKLESDVRRGRIIIEGETTRSSFDAWQHSRLAQPLDRVSAGGPSPARSDQRSHTTVPDKRAWSREAVCLPKPGWR